MNYARRGFLYAVLLLVGLAGLMSACTLSRQDQVPLPSSPGGEIEPTATPSPEPPAPTAEPPPPSTLIVCLEDEPVSLYTYALSNRETDVVLEAIYDGPFDLRGYQVWPVILDGIPSLDRGDATIEEVTIRRGEVYLNPDTRQPENLAPGKPYQPVGCQNSYCIENYWGGEIVMERMVVEFRLLPNLKWSDGEALTASDSVFSYQLDSHLDTPTTKYMVDRTVEYQAIDELTVRWTGIPGFLDNEYMTNFWSPLPEHVLGVFAPGELLGLEQAARLPLGWGPYAVNEWQAGVQIVLFRNPNYFRSAEGLPAFERLIFRFLGEVGVESALQQLITGECDVLDEALIGGEGFSAAMGLAQGGRIRVSSTPGPMLERLEFNIIPVDRNATRFFFDARTRRALGACIDRQAIVDQILLGLGELSDTYLPAGHPLYSPPAEPLRYDPDRAANLFTQAGWIDVDSNPDTPLLAQWAEGAPPGTEFVIHYATTEDAIHEALANHLREDLARCGVRLEIDYLPASEMLAPWPGGAVFNRSFDTAVWAWPTLLTPQCDMFSIGEIPSDEKPYGINASGFRDWDYDQACQRIHLERPGSSAYYNDVRATQEIFASQLPAVPLFLRPRVIAYREDLCTIELDSSTLTAFSEIEGYNRNPACAGE